jgi:hypothetical protein
MEDRRPGDPILDSPAEATRKAVEYFLNASEEPAGKESPSYRDKALEVAELLERKAEQYGQSYEAVGDILKMFYPNGISPDQYSEVAIFVRILDVMHRKANGGYSEAFRYIAGYGLLGMVNEERQEN